MSGVKKGTIIVECDQALKHRFYKILPFTNGLQINFDEDDDCIQIQYELDNRDVESLVAFLNQQNQNEFRLISHVEDTPQPAKEYDLARDISKILAYDDDNDDGLPPVKTEVQGNPGAIGKPMDDKKGGGSNSKGLKSKSSSFYPPNDPRSFMQDDHPGQPPQGMVRGPIGSMQSQKQPPPSTIFSNSVPYQVDDFDQIFEDDDSNYPPQVARPGMGIPGQPMMMNPNLQRGANPNLNPNMNPNAKPAGNIGMGQPMGIMGHPGMGPGHMGPNSIYAQPPQAAAGRFKAGPQGGMGMTPGFQPPKQVVREASAVGRPGAVMQQDLNYYGAAAGMGGYDDGQQVNKPKQLRTGAKKVPAQPYVDEYGGAYAEEDAMHNFNPNEYSGGRAANMGMQMGAGGYQQPQQPRGGGVAVQQPGFRQQYGKEEYQDQRMAYGDVNANMRAPGGIPAQGMRGGMAPPSNMRGMANQPQPMQRYGQQQHVDEEFYEEEYEEADMGAQMGGQPGMAQRNMMGYETGYDEYGGVQPQQPPQQQFSRPQKPAEYGHFGGVPAGGHNPMTVAATPEPFTLDNSVNYPNFDRKPGFDKRRKQVRTREKLRQAMLKNKTTDSGKVKKKTEKGGATETGEPNKKSGDKQSGQQGDKDENKKEAEGSDAGENENNNSRGFLEEEISSASDIMNKANSHGSIEDHMDSDESEELKEN